MIAKPNRFTRRQFAAARKQMKSFRSGPFLFLYRTDERLPSRFAVVIKKKNLKLATARNQLRRRAYESLRKNLLPHCAHLQLICLHQGDQVESQVNIDQACVKFKNSYESI